MSGLFTALQPAEFDPAFVFGLLFSLFEIEGKTERKGKQTQIVE